MTGTYIKFVEGPASKSGKTKTWWVAQKQKEIHLGWVAWWGAWRRYAFYPKPNTVFEETCLEDITAFIIQETKKKRAKKRDLIKESCKADEHMQDYPPQDEE